jgi:hypothetical protein
MAKFRTTYDRIYKNSNYKIWNYKISNDRWNCKHVGRYSEKNIEKLVIIDKKLQHDTNIRYSTQFDQF